MIRDGTKIRRARSRSNSRSRSRSKVCGAYRRGRGLCPGVFRLPPGVIRQPRARPNRTLRPSPNQRPIVLLTPTANTFSPPLRVQSREGIRVTGGSAGSSSFIAAQPPPSSSCCARVQISSSIASSVPDVSSSLTLRATNGNDQRSRSRSRSRSRAWVGTDQRLRMALAVRFVMNLAALAPQFPMPNCRTCLTRWPSSAALQPRAST